MTLSSWCLAFIPHRSAFQQASAQPCYLLPTLSPGRPPGAHLGRVPSWTRQPAPAVGPGRPPAPCAPPDPHCPARTPTVSGRVWAFIPTSGLTPAIPHPAAAPWSTAPPDPATPQVDMLLQFLIFCSLMAFGIGVPTLSVGPIWKILQKAFRKFPWL